MAVKYIKDHKTRETIYPITRSECIIDAHSINNHEIDQLFDESPEYESFDSGMNYLNYGGLKHYHEKISEEIQTGLDNVQVDLTGYATESWVQEQNYLTEHQDISGKVDIEDLNGYVTQQWVEEQNYLTEHQDISNKVDISDFEEATLVTSAALNTLNQNLAAKADKSQFGTITLKINGHYGEQVLTVASVNE